MSDFHNQLMRKIRSQERALGLETLSEDGTVSAAAPAPAEVDGAVFKRYQEVKNATFPVQEVYTDPTGARFQTYWAPGDAGAPVFVLHHGAGSSAMTFCKLVQSLQRTSPRPGAFAFDMRGHGHSDDAGEFGLEALVADFDGVLGFFAKFHSGPVYLVGHSLGGAVLVRWTQTRLDDHEVRGLTMIDIVEETSVTSLSAMPAFLSKVPPTFTSYEQAIAWHIRHTQILHNYDSAVLSVPDLFVQRDRKLHWKIDLKNTQPYWGSWFGGLSSNFITCGAAKHVAKQLLLSGHETLDKDLLIGQMQGKYQLIVFNNANVGHFVHEDIPDHASASLIDFARKNDSPSEYMKNELGFVPKWGGKIHT